MDFSNQMARLLLKVLDEVQGEIGGIRFGLDKTYRDNATVFFYDLQNILMTVDKVVIKVPFGIHVEVSNTG